MLNQNYSLIIYQENSEQNSFPFRKYILVDKTDWFNKSGFFKKVNKNTKKIYEIKKRLK